MSLVDPFFEGEGEQKVAVEARRGGPLEPVTFSHVQDHPFKKRAGRGCGYVRPETGKPCGQGKNRPIHWGAPPSMNVVVGRDQQHAYQNMKDYWQAEFQELMVAAGLPKGLGRVTVEGTCGFPDRRRRDQGNYRFLLEKAMGDALKLGGWLPDDDWLHFEFAGLGYVYDKGRSWTRLTVYPFWDALQLEDVAASAGQQALL